MFVKVLSLLFLWSPDGEGRIKDAWFLEGKVVHLARVRTIRIAVTTVMVMLG